MQKHGQAVGIMDMKHGLADKAPREKKRSRSASADPLLAPTKPQSAEKVTHTLDSVLGRNVVPERAL